MIHDNADAIRTSVTDHSFLPSLTSMRAAAAVAVAIHHTRTAWAHFPLVDFFCQVGWLGVSYFFILSGFVLMRQFDRAASYRTFISKRLARIYPLHLLTLVASLLAFAIIGSPLAGYVGTPLGTVANFLLIHGWIPGHPDIRQAWNGVSWTLSCEFFFYLLAPALFLALDRRRYDVSLMWLFASLFILAFGLSLIGSIRGWNWFLDVLIYHPAPRMFEFALGAYGALLLKKGWTFHSQTMSLVLMTMPVLVYCALFPESTGQRYGAVMNYLFMPGAFLFIMSMAYNDTNNIRSWTSNRFFVQLGNESFSLYMTHALFLWVFTNLRHRVFPSTEQSAFRGEICTFVYIVLCLILAHFCYKIFEKPAQKWLLARMSRNVRRRFSWPPKPGAVGREAVTTHALGTDTRAAQPEA